MGKIALQHTLLHSPTPFFGLNNNLFKFKVRLQLKVDENINMPVRRCAHMHILAKAKH